MNPDGTQTVQDSLPEKGLASDTGQEGTSQATTTKTYTEAEYQRAVKDAQTRAFSDFMAESGRKYKPIEEQNKNLSSKLQTVEFELTDLKDEREDLQKHINDLSADDPDKKILTQKMRDLREKERNLKAFELNLNSEKSELAKWKVERKADELAKKYEVDSTILSTITDGTPEKMEALAKVLSTKKPEPTKEPEKKSAPVITPVDGVTGGAPGALTPEKVKGMSPEDVVRNSKEISKLPLSI